MTSTTFRILWADKNGREITSSITVKHAEKAAMVDVDDAAHDRLPNACDVVLECDPISGYFG